MIDMRDLLGKLLQSNPSGSTDKRVNHALGPQGVGASDSPFGGMLSDLFGPGGSLGQMAQQAGGMFEPGGKLDGVAQQASGLFDTGRQRVESGDPMAIGGLGALAGLVLGGQRGAIGTGALALLGSLAYAALKKSQGAAQGAASTGSAGFASEELASQELTPEELAPGALEKHAPLGVRQPQTPQEEAELQKVALLVIRAMVNAAKADGQIDGGEMSRIMGRLKEAGADDEAQQFMISEMQKPFDPEALIRDVNELGSPEVAVEVYGASLLAIEVDTPAERDYLARLASGLGLSADAVQRVHEALGVQQT